MHVLLSLEYVFSKLHILSKLFAYITAICVQGSLKQVRVRKATESTRGSEIHKPGKAVIEREAAVSQFFRTEKHSRQKSSCCLPGLVGIDLT